MKGFKDKKGKFHPIGKYSALNKSSITKRNIRKAETIGTSIEEMRRNNPENSIGLTDKKFIYGGWDKDKISDDKRREGNVVIEQIFNMTNELYPELGIKQIDEKHLYNDWSTIQNTLRISANVIDKLIDWRFDNDPKTWKWVSPIRYTTENSWVSNDDVVDNNNQRFTSKAYKNEVAITILSPDDFLTYADPIGHGASRLERPLEKQDVDDLAEKLMQGQPMDSLNLELTDDNHVWQHEGQHRALASIIAGIKEVPVIVYKTSGFTEEEQEKIANNPNEILKIGARRIT